MANQKSIIVIVACVLVGAALLFVAIPCCVTSFIFYKYDQEKAAEREAKRQLEINQPARVP